MRLFEDEKQLNSYIQNRIHKINNKGYLKYYIDKNLYDLFSYSIFFKNSYEIEFFTLNQEYMDIWYLMKKNNDYGRVELVDFGYDENYFCYTVSIFCPDLLSYLYSMHDYANVLGENLWMDKCRGCNWSEEEIIEGYYEYKNNCINWFNLHFKW